MQSDPAGLEQTRGMMQRQLNHLVRLVDDLLDASRISRGKLELRKERVDLLALVRDTVAGFRAAVDGAGLQLELSLPPAGAPSVGEIYVDADPVRLSQVLDNFLSNAIKFTEPGGRVRVSVHREGNNEVAMSIRDSGIGIPPEMLTQIFDLFVQVDHSLEKSRGGLGIGLTLAKRLVEMHGGRVEAHSDGAGRGSEFIVRLPVATAPRAGGTDARVGPSDATARYRILIVDDNKDAARSLARLLGLHGHMTETAYDGVEALEKSGTFAPEVVLLDIGLPKLNGYDTCRALRSREAGKRLRIIALTGWGQESDRERSRQAGFDAHIVKPVEFAALLESLSGDGARDGRAADVVAG
jgi:CheY-like chemotaxis protein